MRALSTIWNTNLLLTPNMPAFKNGRIERGYLHKFNETHHTAIAIFPALSYCKPKCERMFTIHQIGSSLSLRAARDIQEGEQICDHVESMNFSLWPRLMSPLENFCECVFCRSNRRKMFDKFQTSFYKCEHPKCGKYFAAGDKCITDTIDVKCLVCGHLQGWQPWTSVLLPLAFSKRGRACLFKHFDYICKHVRGGNDMRMGIGYNIALKCIQAHLAGNTLEEQEFLKIFEICQICMADMEELFDVSFKEYLRSMLMIWDVIALGNLDVPKSVILSTLRALKVIPIQEKKHLLYYYDDYVKTHVK